MRSILITAVVLSAASVPAHSSSAKVEKMQTMAKCSYEIQKLGHDAFSGHRMAETCMRAHGYAYDAALPNCTVNAFEMMFDHDCYTTLAQWEQIKTDINECTVGVGDKMDWRNNPDAYNAASEACFEERQYEKAGFSGAARRPIGYGQD